VFVVIEYYPADANQSSGKSTLINNTLYPICAQALNGATTLTPSPYQSISGLEHLDKCIDIDQSPIGHRRQHKYPAENAFLP
jgi:excinuclease UvrABC ATPase subunit